MDSLTSPGKWGVGLFDLSERVTAVWQSKDFDDDGYGGSEDHLSDQQNFLIGINKIQSKDDDFRSLEKEISHLTLNNEDEAIFSSVCDIDLNDKKECIPDGISRSSELPCYGSLLKNDALYGCKLLTNIKKVVKRTPCSVFNQVAQLPPSMRLSKDVKASVMEELAKCRLNYFDSINDGENLENKERVCKFCLNNREKPEIYSCHVVKDQMGNVICPILKVYKCPLCGATGNNAHTVTYCPNYRTSTLSSGQKMPDQIQGHGFRVSSVKQDERFSGGMVPIGLPDYNIFQSRMVEQHLLLDTSDFINL